MKHEHKWLTATRQCSECGQLERVDALVTEMAKALRDVLALINEYADESAPRERSGAHPTAAGHHPARRRRG